MEVQPNELGKYFLLLSTEKSHGASSTPNTPVVPLGKFVLAMRTIKNGEISGTDLVLNNLNVYLCIWVGSSIHCPEIIIYFLLITFVFPKSS